MWLPHAIYMTTANITDRSGAINMVEYLKNLPQVPKNPVDGGYTEQNFSNAIRGILRAEVEVVKQNELYAFSVFPKRWLVERTFGWLDKYRRLWNNCERFLRAVIFLGPAH